MLQIGTATSITFGTYLSFTKRLNLPTEWNTLCSSAFIALLVGSLMSLASIVCSQPQTPRLLYTLCTIIYNTSIVLITAEWRPFGFTTLLSFLLFWSDLTNPQPLRLTDKSAIEESPLFRQLSFAWLSPLLSDDHPLTWEDTLMLSMPTEISQQDFYQKIQSVPVTRSLQLSNFSIFLWRICSKEIMRSFAFEVADIALKFALPWILKLFLENQEPYLIVLMFIANIGNSIVKSQASYNVKVAGAKLRTGITNAIFEKTLRLSVLYKGDISVTNLTEVDTQRLLDFVIYTHAVWSAPLQVILCLGSIAFILGWESAIAGIVSIVRTSFCCNN